MAIQILNKFSALLKKAMLKTILTVTIFIPTVIQMLLRFVMVEIMIVTMM